MFRLKATDSRYSYLSKVAFNWYTFGGDLFLIYLYLIVLFNYSGSVATCTADLMDALPCTYCNASSVEFVTTINGTQQYTEPETVYQYPKGAPYASCISQCESAVDTRCTMLVIVSVALGLISVALAFVV